MSSSTFNFLPEVHEALKTGQPVVALESTIVAHGMPYPENLIFAKRAEEVVRSHGATPATIAILQGKIHVGLTGTELELLASGKEIAKTSKRDLSGIISKRGSGATTVSATMYLAHQAGIKVFATGGIGGVHRDGESTLDISQDLAELGRVPIVVVSAGAKAILDLPKTLEYLETAGVPVLGYGTNEFPAFYSRTSGLVLTHCADSPEEIALWFNTHLQLGLASALLVANPIPEKDEIPTWEMERHISVALKKAKKKQLLGKELTPFLLGQIVDLTGGRSLKANIALALNNIRLGAEIALAL